MLYGTKIEICAGSYADIRTLDKFNEIDRLELNSHLEEDGLTPSRDFYLWTRQHTDKQILCMVRCANKWTYTEEEKEEMRKDALFFVQNGAGIVIGCLNDDNTIDVPFIKDLIDLAHKYHQEAVFHKAFDVTRNEDEAIQALIDLHCDRVLTAGRAASAPAGSEDIKRLEERYGGYIEIQPCGGVNAGNVAKMLEETGCTRFHMSLRGNPANEEKISSVLEALHNRKGNTKQKILTGEDDAMFINDAYERKME